MVFGLFMRKPQPQAGDNTQTNLSNSVETKSVPVQLRTPSPSTKSVSVSISNPTHSPTRLPASLRPLPPLYAVDSDSLVIPSPAALPPATPSPPPGTDIDTSALRDLIRSVPPKILHSYILSRIPSPSSSPDTSTCPPLSPHTISSLSTLFSTLTPPPRLHCVRCHKDFFEVENSDWSCLVPHDDESAEVERVGWSGRREEGGKKGEMSAKYETLWGCCGRTVEGDGDMGPPDGWCYEGKHTTDPKRARFRADSTPQQDKLTSCLRLNCHGIRDQLPARTPTRATRKRSRKSLKEVSASEEESEGAKSSGVDDIINKNGKRRTQHREVGEEEDDHADDAEDTRGRAVKRARSLGSIKSKSKPKTKAKAKAKVTSDEDEMNVDDAPAPPRSRTKSRVRAADSATKINIESPRRSRSQVRAPPSARKPRSSARSKSRARTKKVAEVESATENEADKPKKRRKVA